MATLSKIEEAFGNLPLSQRVIGTVAIAVAIALGGNLALLKPQRLQIDSIRAKEKENATALDAAVKALAELDSDEAKGVDRFAKERAQLSEFKRHIAEADTFFSTGATTSANIDGLLRSLIQGDTNLTLITLKLLPVAVFYAPPAPPAPDKNKSLLESLTKATKKAEPPPPPVLSEKTLYKHGVEVVVRGRYPSLVAFLERIQGLPHRVYWADVAVNVSKPPEAQMRVVIFTVSDQAATPLN